MSNYYGKITWCIECTDDKYKNAITNHHDDICGALTDDDRFGECIGTTDDYNMIVHKLKKRVSTYTSESYSASFIDDNISFVQTNIANKNRASIFSIKKQ